MKWHIASAAMVVLFAITAAAQLTGSANRATADNSFVARAAAGGLAEVELGKLAADKASSQAVKEFARKMVDDHTKANEELKQIAQSKNLDLPATLDPQNQALKDRLSGLSGAEFDRQYMAGMVRDHKATVDLFQHEAKNGKDPELKAFASKTLPELQQHLQTAEQTQSQVPKK